MAFAKGPRLPTPEDWANKQIEKTAASGDAWLKGALNPRKNPVEEMAKSNAFYKSQMQKALSEDRFAKGVAGIDQDEMAQAITDAGASTFVNGVQRRAPKIKRRIAQVHSELTKHVGAMDAMPVGTPEQREAKMLANLRGMRGIGEKLRGK